MCFDDILADLELTATLSQLGNVHMPRDTEERLAAARRVMVKRAARASKHMDREEAELRLRAIGVEVDR